VTVAFKVVLMIILVHAFLVAHDAKDDKRNKFIGVYIATLIALMISFFVW